MIATPRIRGWSALALTTVIGAAAASFAAPASASAGPLAPVIVRGQAPSCGPAIAADVTTLGGHVTRSIKLLGGGAALVPRGALLALGSAPCVAAVTRFKPPATETARRRSRSRSATSTTSSAVLHAKSGTDVGPRPARSWNSVRV